jgi:hypothetical protein
MGSIDMKEYTERLLEMLQKGLKETPNTPPCAKK